VLFFLLLLLAVSLCARGAVVVWVVVCVWGSARGGVLGGRSGWRVGVVLAWAVFVALH